MATPAAPAVLFLEEDEPGRPAYTAMMSGFRRTLREGFPGIVSIYPENLDLPRFSNEDYRDQAGRWLREKYRGKKIDVIVASGPVRMELAKTFREEFWPDARIVGISGAGGNRSDGRPGEPPAPIARLAVSLDVAGTLDAAVALMPEATRLVVVVGAKSAYAGMNQCILRETEVRRGQVSHLTLLSCSGEAGMRTSEHAESVATSVSGCGLPRDGPRGRRQSDLRGGCGRECFSVPPWAGLHEPRMAGPCMGADEEPFPSPCRDTRTQPRDRDEISARHFQPGMERAEVAERTCFQILGCD